MSDFDVMKRCLELQKKEENVTVQRPMFPPEAQSAIIPLTWYEVPIDLPEVETPLETVIKSNQHQVFPTPKYFHLEDDMLPRDAANPTEGTTEPEIKGTTGVMGGKPCVKCGYDHGHQHHYGDKTMCCSCYLRANPQAPEWEGTRV